MSKYFIIGIFLFFITCKGENNASLQISITSINNTSLSEIKALYLTDLTNPNESISFQNIKCVTPNLFLIKKLGPGSYYATVNIEQGARYYIDLGNITIKQGSNKISKEINLGSIKLPN